MPLNLKRLFFVSVILISGSALAAFAEQTNAPADAPQVNADFVVYGCTSGGVSAAVTASRQGLSSVLVCPRSNVGAMQSEGLGYSDFGDKRSVGGIALEFFRRMKAHYDDLSNWRFQERSDFERYDRRSDTIWQFEPSAAEDIMLRMIDEQGIPLFYRQRLDRARGVSVRDGRITEIRMLDGRSYRGRVFVDATFEGDLMAAAGVSYTVGREPNSQYGEYLNGVQVNNTINHQFTRDVSAYIDPDDPDSGLLPGVHGTDPGVQGEGDTRLQSYNFRVCLTKVEANRVPFRQPATYDPMNYELLSRYLDAGFRNVTKKFDPIPNAKTDTNNFGAVSTNFIGENYAYPEASYEERAIIEKAHRDYQEGYFWFLANDPRVPEEVREELSQWGLCADEFADNDHWPRQIYVREARRMVSDLVMTELHVRRILPIDDSIGMGAYTMDSHNTQRYVDENGHVRNEGNIEVPPGNPYPISYRIIVPRRDEVTNLYVTSAVSASHIAYGSIRMEPVFMSIGEASGIGGAIAIEDDLSVQDVPYGELKTRLLQSGAILDIKIERPRR